MNGFMRIVSLSSISALALTLAVTAGSADDLQGAGGVDEFSEADVFIEINATDGDAGFQGIMDGDPWGRARLRDPDGRNLFQFKLQGDALDQGFTEFFWESAEPPFDEVGLAEFLDRFPEGEYSFRALTLEGGMLASTAELTHDLPAGPVITSPEEDDVVDPGLDMPVSWEEVVDDFQRPGMADLGSDIIAYVVTIETEFENEDGDEAKEVMNIDVPADELSTTVPADFLKPDRHYKVEIGAREESLNSTFSETPFCTHAAGECPDEEE